MWRNPRQLGLFARSIFRYKGTRGITYQSFSTTQSNPLVFIQQHRRKIIYAGAACAAIYAAGLEQAPVSGRWRFMIVPRWLELYVGSSSYRQILHQFQGQILNDNHPQARRVSRIMQRVIEASELRDDKSIDWRVHVVVGPNPPNAFVLPGGKVFVFDSILPITQNDDGLATVLSHELAHQVCRHTAESMSKSPFLLVAALAINAAIGSSQISSLLVDTVLRLPASRAMESEADYVGVLTMAKACFNPPEAVRLWQRMQQVERKSGQLVPQFLSTHPASELRIQRISDELPEAMRVRDQSCVGGSMLSGFWQQ